MKLFSALLLVLTFNVFASIPGSDYDRRHQLVILKAINSQCGYLNDLELLSSRSEVIQVDQGIRDVNYLTVLRGTLKIDQGVFASYVVTIASHYGDFYDHESGNHGHYSVSNVSCEIE